MKGLISFQLAGTLATWLFGLFGLFHLAVIVGMLLFDYAPVDFLWGGRLTTREELLHFEIISLAVISVCLLAVMIRSGRIHAPKLIRIVRVILWLLLGLFILNTVGNLLAESLFEKFFSIVTALFALLSLRLAVERT